MAKRKRSKPVRSRPTKSVGDLLQSAINLHQSGKFDQAETLYRQILKGDAENTVAHHLLGRLFWQTERKQMGLESLQRALETDGQSVPVLVDLANMQSELGQLELAEACLLSAIRQSPQDALPLKNLGVVLKEQRRYEEAIDAYERALAIEPDNAHSLTNLAHAQYAAGNFDEAVRSYRQVISRNAADVDSLRSLASVLRRTDRHEEAREVLAAWISMDPDDPVPRHLLSAYGDSQVPERASDGYVRILFDRYADTFDADLGRLGYRGPAIIEGGLRHSLEPSTTLDCVLDAGCGTGLCAPVLRPYAKRLIGVDLSRKMLDIAEKRNLYDELIEAELCDYLTKHKHMFDLIACADTFGYFGNLETPFAAARVALLRGGIFMLTVEITDDACPDGYLLRSSGRYAHSRDYAMDTCIRAGFRIAHEADDVLRKEASLEVNCLVLTAIAD